MGSDILFNELDHLTDSTIFPLLMFNKEGSFINNETPTTRPTSTDIDTVVLNQKINRRMSRMGYESTKNQFMGWAEGDNDEARTEYYPGWTDQDFSELLERLEKMENAK